MSDARTIPGGRVVVAAPVGRDGPLICSVLGREGIEAVAARDVEAFCGCIRDGADVAIVAEEMLAPEALERVVRTLRQQPSWSDVPLIVLGVAGSNATSRLFDLLSPAANPILLERPTRPFTVVSMTKAALRARQRQHATRLHLEEIDAGRQEIARHRDELIEAIRQRTAELQVTHNRLRLSERMAALGTLAAGVGHDIANLLMPIHVRLDTLAVHHDPIDQQEGIAAIRSCIGHLQRLSSGLRQLALDPHDIAIADETTDLFRWWEQAEPILRTALPRPLLLEYQLPAESCLIAIPPHQLTQAVFNLVQNAGEVMKSRGHGRVVLSASMGERNHLELIVTDDGPGMTDEVKARCLEPLFTTKTRQLSTGLGLSLVQAVVQRAGGRLQIDTQLGRGTAFTMVLPVRSVSESRGGRPQAAVMVGDLRARSIICATLEAMGFDVAPADEPAERSAVWIVDAIHAEPVRVREYVNDNAGRRVVMIGDRADAISDDRVIRVAELRPSLVRQALHIVASDLRAAHVTA